jgi:hypothetical protein
VTVATWLPNHAYTAGAVVNPAVANQHSFYCSVGGTSGASEPAWVGRYQNIVDNSVTWVPYTIVTPAQIRQELKLDPEGTGGTIAASGQYADSIIGPYILDAIASLQTTCARMFVNTPGLTWIQTSQGVALLPLPGFRTVSSQTYQGATQAAAVPGTGVGGYALLPDAQQTGVYTGIQFRPFRIQGSGPWWLSLGGDTSNWFDTGADNPYDPRNYGGGYISTSVPNDTVTIGDAGYEPGFEPGNVVHAVEVLSSWYVMRPPALLADSVITPAGGIVSYSQMPPEVQDFVRTMRVGRQVVSVG